MFTITFYWKIVLNNCMINTFYNITLLVKLIMLHIQTLERFVNQSPRPNNISAHADVSVSLIPPIKTYRNYSTLTSKSQAKKNKEANPKHTLNHSLPEKNIFTNKGII